jgi:endonuclease/exonuclease/phosphatase family metal-dependent hydrolase
MSAQDTLLVMSYNLLNYSASSTARDQYHRTVLAATKPDVLAVDEITTQADVDAYYSRVLNVVFPGQFSKAAFVYRAGDTNQELFYRTSKVSFISNTPIHTDLRDINEFKLYVPSVGDTVRLYALHLKASTGSSNEVRRASEVDNLRAVTNALPAGKFFMTMGDFNIYKSSESAYQKLIQIDATDDGAFFDAFTMTGTWNDASYAKYHTQSTRVPQLSDGGSSGGLNDRFDMILYSRALMQGTGKIGYVSGSMSAVGNDGFHYQQSINQLPNYAVPDSVANALYSASDHLPVITKLALKTAQAGPQTVLASAGSNGSISPSGSVNVPNAGTQQFTFVPVSGYRVDSVVVDGKRVDSLASYTFSNVTTNHTIAVTFTVKTAAIVASAGSNGSISPGGSIAVPLSASLQFLFSPAPGYRVDTVLVDGVKVDSTATYTFANVSANHTISVSFAALSSGTQSTLAVVAGWNLISVPRNASDMSVGAVAPFAVAGTVTGFLTGSYTQPTALNTGEGYWAYSGASGSSQVQGTALTTISLPITTGNRWVLLGSVTSSVPVTSLLTQPSGAIVPGTIVGWDGSKYFAPQTIEPGKGYWVFVSSPCTLTLTSP